MRVGRWVICWLLLGHCGYAQKDSASIQMLLERIATQQVSADAFFTDGVFPSYISNQPRFSRRKKDNNIFFTALIDVTLANAGLRDFTNNDLYAQIRQNASVAYPFFQNKKKRLTYNFWRTDTAYPFPYTWWIKKVKHNTALPDDMDDTVLALLAQQADSATVTAAHSLMQQYTNNDLKKKTALPKAYRHFEAYSVWYGRQFPVVFDVCVLSNVLFFVQQNKLPWTRADSASLHLILTAIDNKDYQKRPLRVSPYYGQTSIIIYHLARLMSVQTLAPLEAKKEDLKATALQLFYHTKNTLEKTILATAILRLGGCPPPFEMPSPDALEQNDFSFFIGNIPSYFPRVLQEWLWKKGVGLFYHYCPAYNNALMVEYLALRQSCAPDVNQ